MKCSPSPSLVPKSNNNDNCTTIHYKTTPELQRATRKSLDAMNWADYWHFLLEPPISSFYIAFCSHWSCSWCLKLQGKLATISWPISNDRVEITLERKIAIMISPMTLIIIIIITTNETGFKNRCCKKLFQILGKSTATLENYFRNTSSYNGLDYTCLPIWRPICISNLFVFSLSGHWILLVSLRTIMKPSLTHSILNRSANQLHICKWCRCCSLIIDMLCLARLIINCSILSKDSGITTNMTYTLVLNETSIGELILEARSYFLWFCSAEWEWVIQESLLSYEFFWKKDKRIDVVQEVFMACRINNPRPKWNYKHSVALESCFCSILKQVQVYNAINCMSCSFRTPFWLLSDHPLISPIFNQIRQMTR